MRGATSNPAFLIMSSRFQSTLPMRGATPAAMPRSRRSSYFNPRSPCGERPHDVDEAFDELNFNPRSPCGERPAGNSYLSDVQYISIHAPHAGSDYFPRKEIHKNENFNPRSPCGERPGPHNVIVITSVISIHAPHAGSDGAWCSPT